MDMSRYLKKWLTEKALAEQHDSEYEGVVSQVSEQTVRNRFTGQPETLGVVTFDDGWLLGLNKTFLKKFITWFGTESENWIGRRVRVYRRELTLTNAHGVTRTKWVRDLVCEDPLALARMPSRKVIAPQAWTDDGVPGPKDAAVVPPVDEVFGKDSFVPRERTKKRA